MSSLQRQWYIKIPHESVEKLDKSVIAQCSMCESEGEIDELKTITFLSLMMILTGCTEFAMLTSTTGLAVSHNTYVKAYNGFDFLTILSTERILKHIYMKMFDMMPMMTSEDIKRIKDKDQLDLAKRVKELDNSLSIALEINDNYQRENKDLKKRAEEAGRRGHNHKRNWYELSRDEGCERKD